MDLWRFHCAAGGADHVFRDTSHVVGDDEVPGQPQGTSVEDVPGSPVHVEGNACIIQVHECEKQLDQVSTAPGCIAGRDDQRREGVVSPAP